jgi:hypothetical protein
MKKWLVLGAVAMFAVMAAGSAQAEIGVGILWNGGYLMPDMTLPISLESGIVIMPQVGFLNTEDFSYMGGTPVGDNTPKFTQIRFGGGVEKQTMPGGTTPVFGGYVQAMLNSFSDLEYGTGGDAEEFDSRFDVVFGLYVGGSAALGDNVDIVGLWGPQIYMTGEQTAGDEVIWESSTEIGSSASIMFRWWLWGQ